MSGLILCPDRAVTHPYYVGELGLHLYTGEELSYFIYHNILLINEDFLDERLFEFLSQLGQEKLEERIRRLKDQLGLFDILYVLLQELRYYSSAELFSFKKQLDRLGQSSSSARLKAKGDYLFENGQFYNALRVYDQVLSRDEKELADSEFVAAVWNNKGSCYARMEAYGKALECLENAYELSRDTALLERMYVLNELLGGDRLKPETKSLITPVMERQFADNLEDHRRLALFTGKALEVAALEEIPEAERGAAYLELLTRWKEEYRRNQV